MGVLEFLVPFYPINNARVVFSSDSKMDPLKLYPTQNEKSLRMESHSKLNVTQNGMSLKMECHSKWNVTQNKT